MYAIICDEEENPMHVAMNDVEEGNLRELKVEYAWHVMQMHDLIFKLPDKRKKKYAPFCLNRVGPNGGVLARLEP